MFKSKLLIGLVITVSLAWGSNVFATGCFSEAWDDDYTVGLWHFNEGSGTFLEDSSIDAFHASLAGSVLPTWVNGRFGKGLHLAYNTSNGVNLSNDAQCVTSNYGNFTLEMNFKWEDPGSGNDLIGALFSSAASGTGSVFARAIRVPHTDGPATYKINYGVRHGDGTWYTVDTPATLGTEWYHFAFTRQWDGVNTTFCVYVDGELAAKGVIGPYFEKQPGDPVFKLYLGANSYAGFSDSISGIIDEVRFSYVVRTKFPNNWGHAPGDINKDCYVNFNDMVYIAQSWLN